VFSSTSGTACGSPARTISCSSICEWSQGSKERRRVRPTHRAHRDAYSPFLRGPAARPRVAALGYPRTVRTTRRRGRAKRSRRAACRTARRFISGCRRKLRPLNASRSNAHGWIVPGVVQRTCSLANFDRASASLATTGRYEAERGHASGCSGIAPAGQGYGSDECRRSYHGVFTTMSRIDFESIASRLAQLDINLART